MNVVQNPILSTSSFCMACIHVQLYKKNSGGGGGGHGGVCVCGGGGGGKRGLNPLLCTLIIVFCCFLHFMKCFV